MNKTTTKKLRQEAVLTYKPIGSLNRKTFLAVVNHPHNPFKNHFRRLKRAYNRGEA